MVDYEFRSARKDWDAVFRNWIRKEAERSKPRNFDKGQQQVDSIKNAIRGFVDAHR
jgi:hypothetical protein